MRYEHIRRAAVATMLMSLAASAHADEFTVSAGAMNSKEPDGHSYAWMLSYLTPLTEHIDASVTWSNEGHVPGHHRDGHSAQLWWRSSPLWDRLVLSAGVGPYHYFDTTKAANGSGYSDDHGVAVLYSAAATYYGDSNLLYQLRLNRVQGGGGITTNSIQLGLGYQLTPDGRDSGSWQSGGSNNEVTLLAGQTIVNSFHSETGIAKSLEYRYSLSPVVKLSGAWINEGDTRLTRRNGGALQAWLEPEFYDKKLTLGVGGGIYGAFDRYQANQVSGSSGREVSGIVTLTASYGITDHLRARINWHRIVTDYSRDSDIILVGLGYQF